jgi:hypothetical protein
MFVEEAYKEPSNSRVTVARTLDLAILESQLGPADGGAVKSSS